MKKILIGFALLVCISKGAFAQQYMTRNGFIGFYSKTPLEDIRAENNQLYAVIDVGKKNLAFMVLLKGFAFTKELMQEHFNENYVESDKYPKATFTGSFTGDPGASGTFNVVVKGVLTLHNVSRPIEVPATLEMKSGVITGRASFKLKPEDFNIQIPSIVRDKIASDLTVQIMAECKPTK